MGQELENDIIKIRKFIGWLYKPIDIGVVKHKNPDRYIVLFYFNEIGDEYIKNNRAWDIKAHKENMLSRDIRTDVRNYLGIKTAGLQPPDFFAPSEDHPIHIFARQI